MPFCIRLTTYQYHLVRFMEFVIEVHMNHIGNIQTRFKTLLQQILLIIN